MSTKTKKKLLFVDIPFCSEGHILNSLDPFAAECKEHCILTYGERFYTIKHKLSDLTERFVFSIVRNPWERSYVRYRSSLNRNRSAANQTLLESIREEKPLEYYISNKKYPIFPRISDTNDINYLMRYENLEDDFARVARVIAVSGELVSKPKYLLDESWKETFDLKAVRAVQKKHHFEIMIGRYVF